MKTHNQNCELCYEWGIKPQKDNHIWDATYLFHNYYQILTAFGMHLIFFISNYLSRSLVIMFLSVVGPSNFMNSGCLFWVRIFHNVSKFIRQKKYVIICKTFIAPLKFILWSHIFFFFCPEVPASLSTCAFSTPTASESESSTMYLKQFRDNKHVSGSRSNNWTWSIKFVYNLFFLFSSETFAGVEIEVPTPTVVANGSMSIGVELWFAEPRPGQILPHMKLSKVPCS